MFIGSEVGKWTKALGSTVFLQLKIHFKSCIILKCNSSPDSSQTARVTQPSAVSSACNFFPQGRGEGWPLLCALLVIGFGASLKVTFDTCRQVGELGSTS